MEAIELQKTTALLQRNWGIATTNVDTLELLLAALEAQLLSMLQDNFEGLVQTMYRLDVSEPKFHAAMTLKNAQAQAAELSKIVFARELQRLATWEKYSNSDK